MMSANGILDRVRRFGATAAGVATTEFALTAPIFVIMALGVIDVGNAVVHKFDLNAMARIGAEYALAHSTDAEGVKNTVLSAAKRDNSQLTVETTVFCECTYEQVASCETSCPDGETLRRYVKVRVSEFYHPLFLPDPDDPETQQYSFFQEITQLASEVTLRLE